MPPLPVSLGEAVREHLSEAVLLGALAERFHDVLADGFLAGDGQFRFRLRFLRAGAGFGDPGVQFGVTAAEDAHSPRSSGVRSAGGSCLRPDARLVRALISWLVTCPADAVSSTVRRSVETATRSWLFSIRSCSFSCSSLENSRSEWSFPVKNAYTHRASTTSAPVPPVISGR